MTATVQIPVNIAPHLVEVLRRMEEGSTGADLAAVQAVTSWALCGGPKPARDLCDLASEALMDRVVESAQAGFDARNPDLPELGAVGFEEWPADQELAACWLLEQLCGEAAHSLVTARECARPVQVAAAVDVASAVASGRWGEGGIEVDPTENDMLAGMVRARFAEAFEAMDVRARGDMAA